MADDANPTVAIPSEGLLVPSLGKPEDGLLQSQCATALSILSAPGLLPWPWRCPQRVDLDDHEAQPSSSSEG
jgi:hypothetical protein